MVASRALRCVTLVAGLVAAASALAATPALVIDVDSGKVLYAERATDPWFPASITKLMTVYVALDMVRARRASMDQVLTLSEDAAAQPPSKMGFKPGTQLTLDNALKIIMVKSANDIAQTIAENLGGSVDGFAALMNDAAQRLGMRESRWVNPHGLPDERQQTSARDMAILGRALLRDFPDRADLFRIGALRFGRSIMRNHNGLLGRYPGVDGMKTGFICSGGFNVVASATQNGRRIITVVLGSSRANERNLRAADLFDRGFSTSGWFGRSLDELPASSLSSPPDMRPVVCNRRGPMPSEEEAVSASAGGANADNPGALFAAFGLAGANPAPTRRTLGPRAYFEPIRVWIGATPPAVVAGEEDDPGKPARKGALKAAAKAEPKPLARTAKTPTPPAAATAYTASQTPAVLDESKDAKAPVRPRRVPKPALAAKPLPATAAVAANPLAKPASKPLAKTAAVSAKPEAGMPKKPEAQSAAAAPGRTAQAKTTSAKTTSAKTVQAKTAPDKPVPAKAKPALKPNPDE